MFSASQVAFRTSDAAATLLNEVQCEPVERSEHLVTFLDFIKDIDTVKRVYQLTQIDGGCGIRGVTYRLITSWKSDEKQYDKLEIHQSMIKPVNFEVLQSSFITPQLVLVYENVLTDCC